MRKKRTVRRENVLETVSILEKSRGPKSIRCKMLYVYRVRIEVWSQQEMTDWNIEEKNTVLSSYSKQVQRAKSSSIGQHLGALMGGNSKRCPRGKTELDEGNDSSFTLAYVPPRASSKNTVARPNNTVFWPGATTLYSASVTGTLYTGTAHHLCYCTGARFVGQVRCFRYLAPDSTNPAHMSSSLLFLSLPSFASPEPLAKVALLFVSY